MQLHIPAYGEVRFSEFEVDEPYASVWTAHHLFDLTAHNDIEVKRNYSLAPTHGRPERSPARELRFNVRIATPPSGQDCDAGTGSSWVWRLRPGDDGAGQRAVRRLPDPRGRWRGRVRRRGSRHGAHPLAPVAPVRDAADQASPSPTGTAPARGRRSSTRTSSALWRPGSRTSGSTSRSRRPCPRTPGRARRASSTTCSGGEHLARHADPSAAEYFLCGPPVMVHATRDMLRHEFGVATRAHRLGRVLGSRLRHFGVITAGRGGCSPARRRHLRRIGKKPMSSRGFRPLDGDGTARALRVGRTSPVIRTCHFHLRLAVAFLSCLACVHRDGGRTGPRTQGLHRQPHRRGVPRPWRLATLRRPGLRPDRADHGRRSHGSGRPWRSRGIRSGCSASSRWSPRRCLSPRARSAARSTRTLRPSIGTVSPTAGSNCRSTSLATRPMRARAFAKAPRKTVVGTSLTVMTPTGEYDELEAHQPRHQPLVVQAGGRRGGAGGAMGRGRLRRGLAVLGQLQLLPRRSEAHAGCPSSQPRHMSATRSDRISGWRSTRPGTREACARSRAANPAWASATPAWAPRCRSPSGAASRSRSRTVLVCRSRTGTDFKAFSIGWQKLWFTKL